MAERQGIEPSSLAGGTVFKTAGTPLRRDAPFMGAGYFARPGRPPGVCHLGIQAPYLGAQPGTRTRKLPALNGTTLPFAQPRVTGVREEIRTPAGHALNVLPLPIGLRERDMVAQPGNDPGSPP